MDGKVQSRVCLKSFHSGMIDIALPLLDFGSAHKPWKAPDQQGIADTHTLPPTDTALLQSRHSQAP